MLQLILPILRPNIRRAGKCCVSPVIELQDIVLPVLAKRLSVVLPLQHGINLQFLALKADIEGSA